jgi:hypothetical protein
MIETVFLLAIGLGLVILLFLLSQSGPSTLAGSEEERASQTILIALEFEPPSQTLINRILAQEDLNFICREAPSLGPTFLQERRNVAFIWLRETRANMGRLFRFYRLVARSAESLSLAMEFKTLANYASFLALASVAQCLIYVFGPFHARGAIARVFITVNRVFSGLGRTVAALEPAARARIETEWARQSQPAG